MKIIKLLGAVLICLAAGAAGAVFTTPAISSWYADLAKPEFNPPSWIFAPVWNTLFILMGVALFLIIKDGFKRPGVKAAAMIFGAQLLLNIFWSVLFFGLKSPGGAMIEIFVLWIFILLTIIKFYKISKAAAYLLIPYILWVSFAAVLNFWIWQLNMYA